MYTYLQSHYVNKNIMTAIGWSVACMATKHPLLPIHSRASPSSYTIICGPSLAYISLAASAGLASHLFLCVGVLPHKANGSL